MNDPVVSTLENHVHRFLPATAAGGPPILALHGTGGDENDLLDLARHLAPDAAVLSPRGRVLENGMPRFFRRLSEGVFDEADVVRRAGELAGFVAAARERYGLAAPVALGFSNGANIAAAVMMLHPGVLAGAVLLRAMVVLDEPPPRRDSPIEAVPVLLLSGAIDPIVPVGNAARLAGQLDQAGAWVDHRVLPAGHGLGQDDLAAARDWMRARGWVA